eukprot:PhM_4_TR6077/c0_g1_i1/m.33717
MISDNFWPLLISVVLGAILSLAVAAVNNARRSQQQHPLKTSLLQSQLQNHGTTPKRRASPTAASLFYLVRHAERQSHVGGGSGGGSKQHSYDDAITPNGKEQSHKAGEALFNEVIKTQAGLNAMQIVFHVSPLLRTLQTTSHMISGIQHAAATAKTSEAVNVNISVVVEPGLIEFLSASIFPRRLAYLPKHNVAGIEEYYNKQNLSSPPVFSETAILSHQFEASEESAGRRVVKVMETLCHESSSSSEGKRTVHVLVSHSHPIAAAVRLLRGASAHNLPSFRYGYCSFTVVREMKLIRCDDNNNSNNSLPRLERGKTTLFIQRVADSTHLLCPHEEEEEEED